MAIINDIVFSGVNGSTVDVPGFSTYGEVHAPTYDNGAMRMDFSQGNYNASIRKSDSGRKQLFFSFDYQFDRVSQEWTRNCKPFMFFQENSGYTAMCYLGFEGADGELRVETYYGGGYDNPAGTLYSSNFGGAITLSQINGKRVTFKVAITIPQDMTQQGWWKTIVVIDGVEHVAIDGPVMFGVADMGIQWFGCYCSTQYWGPNFTVVEGAASVCRMWDLKISDVESDIFSVPAPTPPPPEPPPAPSDHLRVLVDGAEVQNVRGVVIHKTDGTTQIEVA